MAKYRDLYAIYQHLNFNFIKYVCISVRPNKFLTVFPPIINKITTEIKMKPPWNVSTQSIILPEKVLR